MVDAAGAAGAAGGTRTRVSVAEARGVAVLCAGNERLLDVIRRVAARQPQSITWHGRARESVSALPTQLPYTAPILPICVERAEGSHVFDLDGNEYIDCQMAYTAGVLGHKVGPVVEAVRAALDRGVGAAHFVAAQVELGERVRAMVPGTERVAFLHAGGEAVAAALRLARAQTGRRLVAKFEGCYHGWNEVGLYNTMLLLSGRPPQDPVDRIVPRPATAGVGDAAGAELLILPYNDPVAFDLIRQRAADLAAVLVDPVPPFLASWPEVAQRFVVELREVTAAAGVPLIFDEVVSGFRMAKGGAQEAFGVSAEMACYGKITSGLGIPLSIVGGRAAYLDAARTDGLFADYRARKAWITSTHAANAVAVAAALAQLRYVDEHFPEITRRLDANHARLRAELRAFSRASGLPLGLFGHPRLQSMIVFDAGDAPPASYRDVIAQSSPAQLRSLLALTFYLRLEGIYAETVPTMNLSAAHTEEDVTRIARAVTRSALAMARDGLLPP